MSITLKRQNVFWILAILLLIIIVVGVLREMAKDDAFSWFSKAKSEPAEVSIINLISDPQKYDGKKVKVVGIGCADNDIFALYISKDDYRYNNNKNAVWLDFKDTTTDTNRQNSLNNKFVIVEGTFNKSNNGLNNGFSGTIEKITRYEFNEFISRK